MDLNFETAFKINSDACSIIHPFFIINAVESIQTQGQRRKEAIKIIRKISDLIQRSASFTFPHDKGSLQIDPADRELES